ncbi:MAG: YHS domain-containing protein [Actinomycetota bacterium]
MKVTDPICGMQIEATETTERRTRDGNTFYFCSAACAQRFDQGEATDG